MLINIIESERLNEYPLFKNFCLLKEKGLRKESFKSLNSFIEEVNKWNTEEQQQFGSWLFGLFEISENIHHVLVHPLEEKILKPLLDDWMISNHNDSRPYRWYGLFLNTEQKADYLKLAIEKGGNSEQKAILELIDLYFYYLWYSFHHISEDLYLGDIEEDKDFIDKIESLNNRMVNEQYKKGIYDDLTYYKNLLNDWIGFKNESSNGFVKWCTDNGKEYEWTKSYYYE
ncbi:hypothetical protein [Bacillus sp. WMMC1349]|uniref:hypothetical protein n=1 Tax=Bacillus sp. WMMC1349 TaxID=2736254 RepID=UPI0028168BC9|nr:hypothetical protein [Bacillus sp. WMMC1349]